MNSREDWEALSQQEREALRIAESYELIQRYKGIGKVTFCDLATPNLYKDESDRNYIYIGDILDAGEDEQGPWALIEVTHHEMQLESKEEVLPGYTFFFNSYFAEPENLVDALEESARIAQAYPSTDTYIDLPIPESHQKFYVKDMHTCVFSAPKE
jgi:hypothetical protein